MDNDVISAQDNSSDKVTKARENVRLALTASADWRKEAREDFRFEQGKQWDSKDVEAMQKQKRPTITINRCRPLINQVSGYFGQNMSEASFLPKGEGDDEICRVAKGVTMYVYDKCMFQRHRKKVVRDRLICGKGYFWVFYDFDYDKMDGMIKIERRSPFECFVDPESVKEDLSDAEFCGVYSWESPAVLKQLYPDSADEIDLLWHKYDTEEVAAEAIAGEPVWYSKQLKKVRVVQYWYKEYSYRNVYTAAGTPGIIEENEAPEEIIAMAKLRIPGVQKHRVPTTVYKYLTFCDDVLLEASESPYKHKRFPLVQEFAYYTGEKDENNPAIEPAGLIRDLKDVQREVNKHRSQRMHIVNSQANGAWLIYGQSTPEFDEALRKNGTTPGALLKVPQSVTKVERLSPDGVSAANVEMERSSSDDFYYISGINPETMGSTDAPSSMSGVAIDRRQRAAFTQVSDLSDESNYSERLILDLLWGDKGRPGLIPQYFTEETVIRIIGDDQENKFVSIRQNMPQARNPTMQMDPRTGQPVMDASGNAIHQVLYDLSKFEFDIKVTPSQSTPTLMQATLFQLIDAQKAGIPIPPEMIMEFMPIGNKAELKKLMRDQASAVKPEPPKTSLSINFKDLPPEAKMALLQAEGIQVDPRSLLPSPQMMPKSMLPPQQVRA